MSENDIQTAICDYLSLRKHFFWRSNNVGVYDPTRKTFRSMPKFSKKGVPDIILIWNGFFVGLEVKQKGKYQSKDQKQFQEDCVNAGGEYYVVRNIEDVVELGL